MTLARTEGQALPETAGAGGDERRPRAAHRALSGLNYYRQGVREPGVESATPSRSSTFRLNNKLTLYASEGLH